MQLEAVAATRSGHLYKLILSQHRWGGRPHSTASCARMVVLEPSREEASMEKISIVGLDLAKNTIQLHAACADGSVGLR